MLADLLFPVDNACEVRRMPGFDSNQSSNQLLSLPIRVSIDVYSILLIELSLERRAIGPPVVRESPSRTRRIQRIMTWGDCRYCRQDVSIRNGSDGPKWLGKWLDVTKSSDVSQGILLCM